MQQQVSLLFAQNTLLTLDDHTDFLGYFFNEKRHYLNEKRNIIEAFLVVQNEFLSSFWFVTIDTPF